MERGDASDIDRQLSWPESGENESNATDCNPELNEETFVTLHEASSTSR
jgi:hypothetical protein